MICRRSSTRVSADDSPLGIVSLENHKLKNDLDLKTKALKDLRRELDEIKTKSEEDRLAWRTKESEYMIKIQSSTPRKVEAKVDM